MGVSIAYFSSIAKIELFEPRPAGIDNLVGVVFGQARPLLATFRAEAKAIF
jgi:hypothetical protein